ncbi:hypothetical protein TrVFT333_004997 [Trichoderma virens FT-333]|nr:hypothetical protein TrVFT333_004997 [Trichoderma virens FT-333]
MSFFRITLHRSAIGLPERTRGVLQALGLRRRMQTVFHPAEPQFAGMIMKVKELVRVQEVERRLTKREVKAERTPDKGFYIERPVQRIAVPNESFNKTIIPQSDAKGVRLSSSQQLPSALCWLQRVCVS